MTNPLSRRELMEVALVSGLAMLPWGSGTALAEPLANPMYPERQLKVLGFFEEPDSRWYETVHAPDFLSFAAPFMARYARNWVKEVQAGETPTYTVITEIQYKSEVAKNEVRRLMNSPAGQPLLKHSIEHRTARGRNAGAQATPERLRLFAVEPRPLTTHTSKRASTSQRRILLLRRANQAGQSSFEAATKRLAQDIARMGHGAMVSFDLFAASQQAGPADAVIYIAKTGSASLPPSDPKALQVISDLHVETRIGAG